MTTLHQILGEKLEVDFEVYGLTAEQEIILFQTDGHPLVVEVGQLKWVKMIGLNDPFHEPGTKTIVGLQTSGEDIYEADVLDMITGIHFKLIQKMPPVLLNDGTNGFGGSCTTNCSSPVAPEFSEKMAVS